MLVVVVVVVMIAVVVVVVRVQHFLKPECWGSRMFQEEKSWIKPREKKWYKNNNSYSNSNTSEQLSGKFFIRAWRALKYDDERYTWLFYCPYWRRWVLISSSSLLLPTLYLGTVAVFIPGSIYVFTMLHRLKGGPNLSLLQGKAEFRNNKYLITIKHKFMT
jgi:hypothetical protein